MEDENKMKDIILRELGMDTFPEDKQKDLLEDFIELTLKRVMLATTDRLDESDLKQLEVLMDEGSEPEKIEEFLSEKIPDYEELIRKVAHELKEELKSESAGQ